MRLFISTFKNQETVYMSLNRLIVFCMLLQGILQKILSLDIIDPFETVKLSVDSTFMKAYSRLGKKGEISDRGVRVGKTERRSYGLG